MNNKIKTIFVGFLTLLLLFTNSGLGYLRPFEKNKAEAIEVVSPCVESQGLAYEKCGTGEVIKEGAINYCRYPEPECIQKNGEYQWECNFKKEKKPCWGATCTSEGWNTVGCQASGKGKNLDIDFCNLPAQVLQTLTGVGTGALTNEILKSLLGPQTAKDLKIIVDFIVWAENRGYTLEQLINLDKSTLRNLIIDFINSGVSALEEYSVSEIKKVIIEVMMKLKIDPNLAREIGNFLEYLVRVKNFNISLILSISPDEFLDLLISYVEYSKAPIIKEILKIKVIVNALIDLNLNNQEIKEFLSFLNWLIESKNYSLQAILSLSLSQIQSLINEFEAELNITISLTAAEIKNAINKFINNLLFKIELSPKVIRQSIRFINFLVNVKNLNLKAILALEVMQLKNYFAEFAKQTPKLVLEILLSVIRPVVKVMIGVDVPPWLLVQIAQFVQFMQQTKGFSLEVIINFSIQQLEEYIKTFVAAQINKITGMRISDIRMIITLVIEGDLIDDIASLDLQAIISQFIEVNISGNFNCPLEPISAGCRAINPGNWRDPVLGGDLIIHPDDNKADKKIKVTDDVKMLRWAQFSPCNIPNFTIKFLGRPIFNGLNFRFPPLEIYGNKLWIDMPTVCATEFRAGRWFKVVPKISHSYFTKKPGSKRTYSFLYQKGGQKQILSICKVPIVGFDSLLRAGVRKKVKVDKVTGSSNYKVEGDNLERIMKKKLCPTPVLTGCYILDVKPKKHKRVYVKEMPASGYVDYMMYWKPKKNWETCRQPMMAGYWLKKEKKDGSIEVIDGAGKEGFRRTVKDFREAMKEVPTFKYGRAWFNKGEKVVVDLWGCLDSGFRIQYNIQGTGEEEEEEECNCTNWTNESCGGGNCSSNEMLQTRSCDPSGCNSESRCVSDSDCVACVPKTCSDLGKECGTWDDGCGNSINCGICEGATYCGYGKCAQEEKPAWYCDNGQCDYSCSYDQDCVVCPQCQANHTDACDNKCEEGCNASPQCDEKDPTWVRSSPNKCEWCSNSCQYDYEIGKPLSYYQSGEACYYGCSISCGIGGWQRKNCDQDPCPATKVSGKICYYNRRCTNSGCKYADSDSNWGCSDSICTTSGWDNSKCKIAPSCKNYSYSPDKVAPGEPSFYGCAPITFKAQGNPSQTRVIVWRTSSTINNGGTYTCDKEKSWYDAPLCWGNEECRCWDSGYVKGDSVTWDGNCTLGRGRSKAEGQKLLYAVWSKCSSGSELCRPLAVHRFIKPGWSGRKNASGPSHNNWDWDCDGQVKKRWTKLGDCSCDKSTFTGTVGWKSNKVPNCGKQKKWITGTGCHKEGIWPVTWWACNKETRRQQCK